MRRIALVFLVAVFAPSLVLGFLALRTAGEQRGILERQSAELYQHDTDDVAARIRDGVLARQRAFADQVRVLLSATTPRLLAEDFSPKFRPEEGAAFVVKPDGSVAAPSSEAKDAARFPLENEAFLNNRAQAEIFPTQQKAASSAMDAALAKKAKNESPLPSRSLARNVSPQRNADQTTGPATASRVAPQIADFKTITSTDSDGVLARFNQNKLELIFWTRPPEAGGYVFGLVLAAPLIQALAKVTFADLSPSRNDAVIAVLDENARPVALSTAGFKADWKHPFVASEIGETLPHWEAALYLREPEQFARSARLVTLTLVLLIALALAAILAGGSLVALDARRQLALARKKTDFVSNVSHELKTPLTSIRMFAELLEENRVTEPEKRTRYLRIIRVESERLTRLINNVLDFARLEKKSRTYHRAAIDLQSTILAVWETQSAHLREAGFACEWIAAPSPYPVYADADAIGQVIVNLLANAEKYAGDCREVTLRTEVDASSVRVVVQDRGIGVPAGEERRIFEAFHRANDSLAGSVPGSGLGLTLADRIARDHGGDIEYRPREGGGSSFTLRLPRALTEESP